MYDVELLFPHCKKVVGKSYASDNTGYIKALKSEPKDVKAKERTFQCKCKCGKLIYIVMGFKD